MKIGHLFFASAAALSESDRYEGLPIWSDVMRAAHTSVDALDHLKLNSLVFKHLNFFNCWHMNDAESDAMWKIYIYMRGGDGVAIRSTAGRLMDCFTETPERIYLGEVRIPTKSSGYTEVMPRVVLI